MGRRGLKIVADANVLVRAVVQDDERQAAAAAKSLTEAKLIAVALPTSCEFVWVLGRLYGFERPDVALALRALFDAPNVLVDGAAAEAGLATFEAGAAFADGVIAFEGERLGGEIFVSFDRKAVTVLSRLGRKAKALGSMK